jgi:alpha-L-fucosidase
MHPGSLLSACAASAAASVAGQGRLPSAAQLDFQALEIGAYFNYNIELFGSKVGNYGCNFGPVSPSAWSAPPLIDTDHWIQTAKSAGAKYAILTAQAGCGFLLYNTKSTVPTWAAFHDLDHKSTRTEYYYTIKQAGYQHDLVKQFFDSCIKYNIKPGISYSVANNQFCGANQTKMDTIDEKWCGDDGMWQETLMLQLEELYSSYGEIAQIRFNGGVPPRVADNITTLIERQQPTAVLCHGPGSANLVRPDASTDGRIHAQDNWNYGEGEGAGGGRK